MSGRPPSARGARAAAATGTAADKRTSRPLPLSAVARQAGVSTMTVSRVINGDPRVNPNTLAAVRAAMTALGYVPRPPSDGRRQGSRARRGLHTGRIAMLFPDTNLAAMRTPLSARLIDGIDRRIADEHLQLIVTRLPAAETLPDCLDPRHADGVLIRSGPEWVVPALRGFPAVVMLETARPPACDLVMPDSPMIGRLAAERLLERGCRQLLLIDDTPHNPAHAARRVAFDKRAGELGAPTSYLAVAVGDPDLLRTQVAARCAAARADLGVFLPGTGMVVSLVAQVVAELGRGPGKKSPVAVVACCHDRELLATLPQAIDNIDIGSEAIAATAVDLLLERIAEPQRPRRTVVIAPDISAL